MNQNRELLEKHIIDYSLDKTVDELSEELVNYLTNQVSNEEKTIIDDTVDKLLENELIVL